MLVPGPSAAPTGDTGGPGSGAGGTGPAGGPAASARWSMVSPPPASLPSISLPSISLPTGGGAIRGIGENFAANPVTGSEGEGIVNFVGTLAGAPVSEPCCARPRRWSR